MKRQIEAVILVLLCAFSTPALGQANPVLCWGSNLTNQLGDGTTTKKIVPGGAHYLSGIKAVSAGSYHNLALTSDGNVYAWGENANGQLGLGDTTRRSKPTLVPGLY